MAPPTTWEAGDPNLPLGRGRPTRLASERPLLRYEKAIHLVQRLIAEGGLVPGDRLPSTNRLASLAGVSLITVRRALDELERAGRVVRHQGVGTFVAGAPIVSEPGRMGELLATLTEGEGPPAVKTILLGVVRAAAAPTIARALGLREAAEVWQISRLRYIHGRPTIVERAVLPTDLVPVLDEVALRAGGSLYRYLADRYGLSDDYGEQYLEVAAPTAEDRRLLELPPRRLVVRVRGVSFSATGPPFDCFEQVSPAGDFLFYVSGQTSRHVIQASDVRDWHVEPSTPPPSPRATSGRRRVRSGR